MTRKKLGEISEELLLKGSRSYLIQRLKFYKEKLEKVQKAIQLVESILKKKFGEDYMEGYKARISSKLEKKDKDKIKSKAYADSQRRVRQRQAEGYS